MRATRSSASRLMCRNRRTDVAASEGSTGEAAGHVDWSDHKIFLIGFSATGKSHSGRLAAQAIGARFVDMDRLIVRLAGKRITEIFEDDGEDEFRRIERQVLRDTAELAGQRVISTGGGVPMDERNRDVMARTGFTIRLIASPETIHGRLNGNRGRRGDRPSGRRAALRPMLSGTATEETSIERIRELLTEREGAYAAAADATINTEGREPPDVASEIVRLIRDMASNSGESSSVESPKNSEGKE